MPRRTDPWSVIDFETYFGVADEIYPAIVAKRDLNKETTTADFMTGISPGCSLADLEPRYVAAAKAWADQNNAPWPPYLPWAEEYSLDHPKART